MVKKIQVRKNLTAQIDAGGVTFTNGPTTALVLSSTELATVTTALAQAWIGGTEQAPPARVALERICRALDRGAIDWREAVEDIEAVMAQAGERLLAGWVMIEEVN